MNWKFATFNVNGIRARLAVVLQWLEQHQPDVLCMQEIKAQEKDFPVDAFRDAGYTVGLRGQKSFNGVAIASKKPADELLCHLDEENPEEEARFIAGRFGKIWVANTYVPQGRSPEDPAFQYKIDFLERLKRWFERRFDPGDYLIWAGDINVAPEDIDVFDPKRMEGEIGCHPVERQAFSRVKSWGFIDLYRKHHPNEKQFTFWDYRLPMSFKRNLGWRLDHILVTDPVARASLECMVDHELRGRDKPSDHTPVWAEFDIERL
ncbi:MAG: exodeoxyribonuclease III [Deltaproteobacteria bacterium]|nr:exodeoxyribonuclease III [Deltaproteobacteria bacterium]